MLNELLKIKHAQLTLAPNYRLIPVHALDMNDENAHWFNQVYNWLNEQNWAKIVRTKSGGISIAKGSLRLPSWDVKLSGACIELTILCEGMWRIQFRQTTSVREDEKVIYGSQAFKIFVQQLEKNGISMKDYAIENGTEVKKEIPKALIKAPREQIFGMTFENAHHVDFHSSHMAGLANTHPEFRETVEYFYTRRKQHAEYKAVLTNTWGYMQSIGCCGARWAHLSKDAIEDTNRRVSELAERVRAAGGMILLFNTDGFWYVADEPYHGEGEGPGLGQWQNDHVNCKFRAKSAGAYEYIENEQYTPIIRGRTKLDKIQPDRKKWQWGSIFTNEGADILTYYWSEDGIIDGGGNLL